MRVSARLTVAILVGSCAAIARDAVQVDLNAAARQYCHILNFPGGWQLPRSIRVMGEEVLTRKFSLLDDYEFRVPGLQGTKFLVRGVQEIADRYYTTNLYQTDLSDVIVVPQSAGEAVWQAATTVNTRLNNGGASVPGSRSRYVEFQGLRFPRTGDAWNGVRISPDRSLLIVQSWSGHLGRCPGANVPFGALPCQDLGDATSGKLFFDVYNGDTGSKLITLTAVFSEYLPEQLGKTRWITERYFILPLDEALERCLVCEFGRAR